MMISSPSTKCRGGKEDVYKRQGYGTSRSEETKRMVELESLIQRGRKEIAALQKRVRTEKQFNRQLELNNEARALKKKVAEWEKEMKNNL